MFAKFRVNLLHKVFRQMPEHPEDAAYTDVAKQVRLRLRVVLEATPADRKQGFMGVDAAQVGGERNDDDDVHHGVCEVVADDDGGSFGGRLERPRGIEIDKRDVPASQGYIYHSV